MSLEKLKINQALGFNMSRETEWCDVHSFKFLRLTAFSDTNITIEITFSPDKIIIGPVTVLKQTNFWTTRKIDVVLNFMKIKVIREGPNENKMIVINVLGRHNQLDSTEPKEIIHHNNLESDQNYELSLINEVDTKLESNTDQNIESLQNRSKSPFRSILKGITPKKNIPKSVSFDRLPAFIPRNSLLNGSYGNVISTIPPPEQNKTSILIFKDNVIQWSELKQDKNEWII
mgnify:CR=1 FL=1